MSDSDKLQKVLAMAGLGSRREMEKWIIEGRVKVNGKVAGIGDRVTARDKLQLRGRLLKNPLARNHRRRVIAYYKPIGEVCTAKDEKGRKTVFDALPKLSRGRWIMVGRLDINTSGLLLFTNDGEFANRLMHPRYQIEREYASRILGVVEQATLDKLLTGVKLDDGVAKFDRIKFAGGEGANSWYHVTLHEGRNREVRRLWESQNLKVSRLTRIRFADMTLPRYLSRGDWQEVKEEVLSALERKVGLIEPPRQKK